MKLCIAFWLVSAFVVLHAEDWTATDGTVYKDVTVLKVEADAVTILDSDGGGLVQLSKLPPTLQKRFNYSPNKAKQAASARVASDQANAVALENEAEQIQASKRAYYAAADKATAASAPSTNRPGQIPTGPSAIRMASVGGPMAGGPMAGGPMGAGLMSAGTNGATTTNVASGKKLSDADATLIRDQISQLQQDITYRQGVISRESAQSTNDANNGTYAIGNGASHGDYDTAIQQDQQQIQAYRAQLAAGGISN